MFKLEFVDENIKNLFGHIKHFIHSVEGNTVIFKMPTEITFQIPVNKKECHISKIEALINDEEYEVYQGYECYTMRVIFKDTVKIYAEKTPLENK